MAWDSSPSAGFSTAAPEALWLPLHANHRMLNVAAQNADPGSLLALYRRLLVLRRATPALHSGTFHALDGLPECVFGYLRTEGESRVLVLLNLHGKACSVRLASGTWQAELSTHDAPLHSGGMVRLRPDEGIVMRVPANP